jgi:hypothetical protein
LIEEPARSSAARTGLAGAFVEVAMGETMGQHILTVTCASAHGQIAAISRFLDENRCYISELAQFDDIESGRFFVRCLFRPERVLRRPCRTYAERSPPAPPSVSGWNRRSTMRRDGRRC